MPELDLANRLTNKVGPLPAWAWAAIPAAGYVAWSYYRARSEPEPVDTGTPTADEYVDDYGLNQGGVSLPGYGSAPGGSSNLPPVETPAYNNQTWFRQASNWLITEGVSSTDVVTALNAYLYGSPGTINSTQMQALQRAIMRFGPAPDPAFVPGTTPTPTPTPTPAVKVPSAPINVRVSSPAKGVVRVNWNSPVSNNGSAVNGYRVALYRSGVKIYQTDRPVIFQADLPSVKAGIYTVGVWARNAKGYGPEARSSTVSVK